MLVLGIDTSCDDTSAAVVEDGVKIISNIVSSQEEIHQKYGGIVPELASRRHIEMIWPVVDEALKTANTTLGTVAAIAVCHGPGLIGSLLVGCSFAKALSFSRNLPLVAVNHLEGHIFSSFLNTGTPEFPFLSLVVSGGHTSLYRVDGLGRFKELGRTRDDAAGEAYDKVAKLLGLAYPGGPAIDKLAQNGDPEVIDFPRAYLPETHDFSFSGLKTAVLHFLKKLPKQDEFTMKNPLVSNSESKFKCSPPLRGGDRGEGEKALTNHPHLTSPLKGEEYTVNLQQATANCQLNNICAGFQKAVVDVLVQKTEWALNAEGINRLTLSGGVAANGLLRKSLTEMAEAKRVEISIPAKALCTDNAAMIAAAGYHHFMAKDFAAMDLNPVAYLPLG